jgi:hypothetical protein
VFEAEPGRIELRPIVEFNARFTLGIIAIGLLRRALAEIRRELSLDPGGLRAFLFRLDAPSGGWPERADAQGGLLIPLRTEDPAAAARIEPGLLLADDREALDRLLAIGRALEASSSDRLH